MAETHSIPSKSVKHSKNRDKKALGAKKSHANKLEKLSETSLGHKDRFDQLLDDAVFGVKKKQ